jgi:2-hydroxy-3-keto-5-methylthiopentenyl-1-phosphate phosphatase
MSELISKIKIMDLYKYKESIFIGDSITDENAAKWEKNSLVFARDKLAEILSDCDYEDWSSFTEIEEKLKNHWS